MTDRDARFRRLFDDHFAYVWGVLRRLGVRADEIEDRALDVFLKVHGKFSEYDESRPIRPWLFGFAYRVASHSRRADKRRREVIGVDVSVPDSAAFPDEQASARQEQSILVDALEELDLDRRAIIVMHDWDGVTVPEIARSLEIPLNTAYSRLRIARGELAEAVKTVSRRRSAK